MLCIIKRGVEAKTPPAPYEIGSHWRRGCGLCLVTCRGLADSEVSDDVHGHLMHSLHQVGY